MGRVGYMGAWLEQGWGHWVTGDPIKRGGRCCEQVVLLQSSANVFTCGCPTHFPHTHVSVRRKPLHQCTFCMHTSTAASHDKSPSMRHHEMSHWDGHIGRRSSQQKQCKFCTDLAFSTVGGCTIVGGVDA